MDRHIAEWKHAVDRLWQAQAPDWTEVAHVVAGIAATAEETDLRHAATQAMPSIRNAAASPQDRMTGVVARRRLGVIRDVLHELTAPKFGRRGAEQKVLSEDERYRAMLGLPLDAGRAQRVAAHLGRTAAMAQLLDDAPLGPEDEPAALYCPAPFPGDENTVPPATHLGHQL